ncbi:unnamed protein product, partial [Tetraodon nigroviridis]
RQRSTGIPPCRPVEGLSVAGTNTNVSSGVPGDGGCDALRRYVLFMQTTQRLTRVWRFPALRVSDWGFLWGHRGQRLKDTAFWDLSYSDLAPFAGTNLYQKKTARPHKKILRPLKGSPATFLVYILE